MDPKIFECFSSNERASKAASRVLSKKFEVDSWTMLVKEASNKNIDEVEPFYEELLKTFPTCGRFWRVHIEHQMKFKRYDKVSKLFQRSLEEVLSIDLYKCYLNYVREVKASEPDLIYKAFRFTLDKVGIDPNAISIYSDYIQFLKEREVDGSYLDSQKITAVRKAYLEGVVNPMFHVDTLWKEYISYEQSINPLFAEKAIQDRSRDYMNARHVAKVWESTIRGLNRMQPPVPPNFSQDELRQVEIWRRYVQWERSNPTKTENQSVIIKRVSYAYKQFLLCFGHHPNIWHEFAAYLDEQVRSLSEKDGDLVKRLLKELTALYERAIKGMMKNNLLIHFAYADFEELRNDKKKALDIYNNLLDVAMEDNSLNLTLIFIQKMRFIRRTEGLKSARIVFKNARDTKKCSHHIYSAAALMEYHCTKNHSNACKIFELGLQKQMTCPNYILSYIDFMNSLNNENDTRALFERVVKTFSLQPKDTVEIWNSFLDFEAAIGDLNSITKVERRRANALDQLFPKCTETSWAIDKYKFQDLYPCSVSELKSMNYDPQQCATSSGSVRELLSSISNTNGWSNSNQQVIASERNAKRTPMGRNQLTRISNGNSSSDLVDQLTDGNLDFPLTALNQSALCLPDLDQMLPFKPVMTAGYGAHTVPGGVFPPPPAVGNLLPRLPQPSSYWGPFVDLDELCNVLRNSDFDELFNNLIEQRRETNKPRIKKQRTD